MTETGAGRGAAGNDRALALVLGGGGARAAYQAGVLRYITESIPGVSFPILSGVSAGAINTTYLANHPRQIPRAAEDLLQCWLDISSDQVFAAQSALSLYHRILGTLPATRRVANAFQHLGTGGSLLDTRPLQHFLSRHVESEKRNLAGIAGNVDAKRLKAACITTTSYSTGQTVTWIQGREISNWMHPNHVGRNTRLTLDHVMASTSLPVLFPAVRIDDAWYGDGGIRLTTPLAPAIHLGATSILAISTRYGRSRQEADVPSVDGPPPLAQIIGIMLNAIFLDALDQDAATLETINELLEGHAPGTPSRFRPVNLLLLRPSIDLAKLAANYEFASGGALRLITRGLGTDRTRSPDWLSMLLFNRDYVHTLMQLGWEDARRQQERIETFLERAAV